MGFLCIDRAPALAGPLRCPPLPFAPTRFCPVFRLLFNLLKALIFLAFLTIAAAAGGLWWYSGQALSLGADAVDFTVNPGSSMRAAARQAAQVLPVHADLLVLLARVQGRDTQIKAGSYEIENGITPLALIDKLTRGDVTMQELSIPEGWTFRQFRAALDAHAGVQHATQGMSDAAVLAQVAATTTGAAEGGAAARATSGATSAATPGASAASGNAAAQIASASAGAVPTHPEGWFFPDTYLFAKGSKDIDILRRAHRAMKKRLAAEWERRAPGVPYANAYEALIMASIVEKETGQANERPQIAGVFVNRLRRGMLLQTDPTIIYGLGETFDGNLRKRDLQTDGPYNTYTRGGLPPTPIALPGLAAIQAALKPAPTQALFFVARGDGSHEFSATLDAHNRAVNKYQRGGR